MQEIYKAADRRQHRANKVGQEFCLLYVDAKHIGALQVSANRVKIAAKLCPAQNNKKQKNDDNRHNRADFHIGWNPLAQLVQRADAGNVNAGFNQFYKGFVFNIELC